MPKFLDLSGQRFTKLIVLSQVKHQGRRVAFLCQCDCGTLIEVKAIYLRTKATKSCGCLPRNSFPTTHGHAGEPEYNAWLGMMARCYNPDHKAYNRYGGRGIYVAERWHTLENFLEDMGKRPSNGHTLERNQNSGPYSKDNCRWATRKDQARNRRSNVYYTMQGITRCVAEWCEIYGQEASVVSRRLASPVKQWTLEEALTVPSKRKKYQRS